MKALSDQALVEIAEFFQALSEPTRLKILTLLQQGEHNVGELAELGGFTAPNVSRHLALLAQRGVVVRESRGTNVYYRIADDAVFALCELVCGHLARRYQRSIADNSLFGQAVPAK